MDEETLTAIRERYPRTSATQVEESARASLEGAELPVSAIYTSTPQEVRDIWALLAEVERLRAENAALREIAQAVAELPVTPHSDLWPATLAMRARLLLANEEA